MWESGLGFVGRRALAMCLGDLRRWDGRAVYARPLFSVIGASGQAIGRTVANPAMGGKCHRPIL